MKDSLNPPPPRLLGILLQPHLVIRLFVKYIIIISQSWTKYMYVALLLQETVSNTLYKSSHFYEELV